MDDLRGITDRIAFVVAGDRADQHMLNGDTSMAAMLGVAMVEAEQLCCAARSAAGYMDE